MKVNNIGIILCIIYLCSQSILALNCAKSCANGGTCDTTTGTCTCTSGWGGDDCSLRVEMLDSGQSKTGEVDSRNWIYYKTITANNAVSLTYSIQQTNTGDCDFYVKINALPSKTLWDAKDTSIDHSFSVTVPGYANTNYYAGVYGYRDCAYVISLAITTGSMCLNDCSGHGDCDFGTCICDQYHMGEDCSTEIFELSETQKNYTKTTHATNEWNYYLIQPPVVSVTPTKTYKAFYVELSQANPTGNYIYLRGNNVPTLFDYDYRNGVYVNNKINIGLGRPTDPIYYVGVYSPTLSTYTLSLSYQGIKECAEQCSSHGSCIDEGSTCFCDDGYSGSSCENLENNMVDGEFYRGYARNNVWNYFHFESNSQSNVMITLNEISGDQSTDCDLYVQADALPTKQSYVYRDVTASDDISLVIFNPLGHTWYVGVYGFQLCSYQIMQTIQPKCPKDCSGNGDCVNQRCVCNALYVGESCSYPLEIMEGVSSVTTSTIGNSFWHYYKYTIPDGISITSVTVNLKETTSTGFIHLFLQRGAIPSQNDYFDSDTSQSSSVHGVYAIINDQSNRDVYIGVYGTSFIPISQSYSYKLGVYSPNISFGSAN